MYNSSMNNMNIEKNNSNIIIQKQFTAAQKLAKLGSWELNLVDHTQIWSDGVYAILGEEPQSTAPSVEAFMSYLDEPDQIKVQTAMQNLIAGVEEFDIYHNVKTKDGRVRNVHARAELFFDENNVPIKIIGTVLDISTHIKLQEETKKSMNILNSVIDNVNNLIFYKDTNFVYMGCNSSFEKFLGHSREEIIGKDDFSFFPQEVAEHFRDLDEKIFENKEAVFNSQWVTYPNGQEVYLHTTTSPFYDENGNIIGLVGNAVDLTKEQQLNDKLNHQAHHDVLTKLPNRILFSDRLDHAIEKAQRNEDIFALLFLDLDRFKHINDSLGHDIGDYVLQITAERIKKVIREGDTLSRLGGDEFTIILESISKATDASLIAKKILKVIRKPIHIFNHELYLSSSIGISLYPEDNRVARNLLKFADSAMYKAKDEGRDNFQFYSSDMTDKALELILMEANLRQALEKNEFIIYFQPITNAKTNRLVGLESLIRWMHPEKGLIPPDKFIPLAEETGLIIPIDQWVMKQAMLQVVDWYKEGLNPGLLSLNMSSLQLKGDEFIPFIEDLLKSTNCNPEWIQIEITESQIMKKPEEAISILNQVSALGITLAIDDFGTGFSSLSQLKRLPIDKLKIDRSFVKELPNDEEDVAISKAIIALAKTLDLHLIAEGAETIEQVNFLMNHGCDYIQGYYFSKPLPQKEMREYIIKHSQQIIENTKNFVI
ncbi:EAL domain-containing protein [Sulfurimonas aquatica]|uniref:EAL domain-containing protein n=2 Tax=Sulfurimonas aquatica TaxID=2672570 RepID=A0A975GC29_9BACT|nr:EAL domain-containing protein [Sulfurimonas aquatica]